ncbi:hypothetical protein O181_110592 [Austropuccinia psidii MF-1]|uniref:Uncharacterized protein n=1 Tax=Austropuccinia psidii MF-1 TaxID=1389203 RepID=A0A9Q3PSJ0_9BASI|nr:hypothetical protein [Austropuccinia psidii MF-1]
MHRGKSRVNRRRLTSRQANVKQDKSRAHVKGKSSERRAHVTLWSYTKSCDIQYNIGSPVPSTQIPHHLIIPQPSDDW